MQLDNKTDTAITRACAAAHTHLSENVNLDPAYGVTKADDDSLSKVLNELHNR